MPEFREVDLQKVTEDKSYTFRVSFDTQDLEDSIREEGLLYNPILVEKDDRYVIVCGYRRISALRKLNRVKVMATVYSQGELGEKELLKMSITENTKRRNLKPIEIAEALERIKNVMGYDNERLAREFSQVFGIADDPSMIERYLSLNQLSGEQKTILSKAKEDVSLAIGQVSEKEDRDALLDLIEGNENISKGSLKKIIDRSEVIKQSGGFDTLKGFFKENDLQNILKNNELSGSKKINTFIDELENRIDPQRKEKMQKLSACMDEIENVLKDYKGMDLRSKVHVNKKSGDRAATISLRIDDMKEFREMIECIYHLRNKISEVVYL